MKALPVLDRVVGTSREHLLAVALLSPAGVFVADLPVDGGTLLGSARPGDRWAGRVAVAGAGWVPDTPTHPLAGFTGHRVRVRLGATVDEQPSLVSVADLIVAGSTVERSAAGYAHTVELVGLATVVDRAAPRSWAPTPGESCQQMIRRVVAGSVPPGWAAPVVVDTSPPVPVPAGYAAADRSGWDVVEDLAAVANVTVFVDAVQRLTIRPPLPSTPGTPVRTLRADADVVAYRVNVGPGPEFANRVELRCSPVQTSTTLGALVDDVVGVAELTTGPVGTAAAGRYTRTARTLTGPISQAAANARAAALLAVAVRGWATVDLDVVPDPRLEPDDDVAVLYPDGTVGVHRVSELTLDLGTGVSRLACRTFTDPPTRSSHA